MSGSPGTECIAMKAVAMNHGDDALEHLIV
jgi:hypothetical protein